MKLFLILMMGSVAQAAFLPVCQRTKAVQDFIVQQINFEQKTEKTCAAITDEDLASLKRIDVSGNQITTFQVDDFSGLPNLEILNIRSNPYRELPDGMLSQLPALNTLVIIGNREFSHLPNDFLEGNPKMAFLHMFRTNLKTISESVFRRLEKLENLQELDLDRTLNEAERVRLEEIFPDTGVTRLNLI